ncbi:MAG: hypothetical protein CL988_04160 [Euryarchaeota archaeon]|nr:hypothetical protein [Euryarchaeota archaeon]
MFNSQPFNAMLSRFRLKSIFAVCRVVCNHCNTRAMSICNTYEIGIDVCTCRTPGRGNFFNKQSSSHLFGNFNFIKSVGWVNDDCHCWVGCKTAAYQYEQCKESKTCTFHILALLVCGEGADPLHPLDSLEMRGRFLQHEFTPRTWRHRMADHWIENHKRDSWRRQAKASGYRARSAFKLKQIQERFTLLREGDIVLDVGCHPGGWAQVATELVGEDGWVIGVDLEACQPVDGSILLVGDITDPHTQQRVLDELDQRPLNSVVSDISPNITGKWDMDQAVAMTLVALVFDFSLPLLCKGGSFVTKLFQGVGVEELIQVVKPFFSDVRRFSPHASRNSSSEVYLVCRNFMPWKFKKVSILENYETALNVKLGGDDIEEAPEIVSSSFRVMKKKKVE